MVILWGVILLFLITLIVRVTYIQLFHNEKIQHEADLRSLKTQTIMPSRGTISDRDGNILAISIPMRDIIADPSMIDSEYINKNTTKFKSIASAIGIDPDVLISDITRNKNEKFFLIKKDVDMEIASYIKKLHIKGISEQFDERRFYPLRESAAPLIGLVGSDHHGSTGMESSYDNILVGSQGKKIVRVDAFSNVVSVHSTSDSQPAKNIDLSIDNYDQETAYNFLKNSVLQEKATSGAAVLVKIDTGEILAMASYPSFNPNSPFNVSPMQMRNVAINDSFEPGSTVKPLVILSGMNNNIINSHSLIQTKPYYVNNHLIKDVGSWGELTVTGILQKSSDVGASHIALAMPASELVNIYSKFGFGKATKINLPGESSGYFPLHRKYWSDIERATFSFGYGLRVTPLQIARAYAALGGMGTYRELSITKVTPPVIGNVIENPETARAVIHMMESDVLPGGSGVNAYILGYCIAAKTGTAEKIGSDNKYNGGYVNYMAGFAPATNPKVALVVVINNPTAGKHYGGTVAAPVFGDILRKVLPHMNIVPDCVH